MKIKYNGMELETITEGYWPEGVTLVFCDDGDTTCADGWGGVVCLFNGHAFTRSGAASPHWQHWAILPPKPAQRRLTWREAYGLWRSGWDFLSECELVQEPCYKQDEETSPVDGNQKLRAPGSDEWVEPTSDLLEPK